jgi:branched-chain amino acid transport system ATP-binding protein
VTEEASGNAGETGASPAPVPHEGPQAETPPASVPAPVTPASAPPAELAPASVPQEAASVAAAQAPPSTATLHVSGLSVARGSRVVVNDVTIDVPPGEVTALLGPNGAGKSSLVLALGGVLRPVGGTVSLGELDLTRKRPEWIRAAGLAIVPEGRRLLPALSVDDNLRVATFTLSRAEAKAGRERALALFPELAKRLNSPARLLSGGEQQMVVLAQALVTRPKIMVIDELSLGLAPVVVARLIPTLRAVADAGTGILLIEQFAALALNLANRAYIMHGGRIEFSGPASELREKPELLHSAYLLRIAAEPSVG